ncbi:hypothetical protein ACEPAH_1889 [Sanghuangporus vaninii]
MDTMHWQTAPVDDNGTYLGYLDSGVPPTSDYTTFVIVHGHTFHAPAFSRLLPLAHNHNARVIALNRRDYVHSTPYSEADLNVLASKDEDAHSQFLRARGLEIARFLCWVITELKVPKANFGENAASPSGGVVLMGWSLGNLFTDAFVAYLDTYPLDVIETLKLYLKSLIIYAAPIGQTGYPAPPDAYNPFSDSDNPKRIAPVSFGAWVTAYYKHPAYSSPQKSGVLSPASLIQNIPEQPYRPPTVDTISKDELAIILDLEPNERSERLLIIMSPSLIHGVLEKTLLGADKSPLPHLNVYYVYGQADFWMVLWAAREFEKDLEKWRINGEHVRPTKVISVPGANHMIHWDDPETFLKLITKGEIPQNNL